MARCSSTRVALITAVAAQLGLVAAVASAPVGDVADEVGIQGRWAYSRQAGPDAMIDMATTPSVQDPDVWFLLACSGDGRLSVALMHADRFPFEIGETAPVQMQSVSLSSISAPAERAQPAQIVIDPNLVRHVMPLLLQEQELAVSVNARDGAVHRYTFALQPNDVALAPLRARCAGG